MTGSVTMLIYEALTTALGAVVVPALPLLALTRHGAGLAERLGALPPEVKALAGAAPIWIHAASVGEVLAAAPLVDALRGAHPEQPILISTTSLTGREAARTLPGVAAVMLLPADVRCIIASALGAVAPSALVIMETEIWPSLLRAATARDIPVALVSGRVSERAAARYALVRPLVRAALACVDVFAMQTEGDARRLCALGASPERVQVVGSLKYARLLPTTTAGHAQSLTGVNGRPVLIAASTQPGEEEVVLQACSGVWSVYPECLLLLAPRRPERFDEVDRLLAERGIRWERRSRLSGAVRSDTQVVMLDSVGELPGLLGTAQAVFVGGTLAPLGGHNVLEPAAAGAPVSFGPHTENVAEAVAALLASGGGACVRNAEELRIHWQELLAEPAKGRVMGARAREVVQARGAVVEHTLAVLARVLR